MKNSYYSTPRTLRDCTFSDWGDPVEKYVGSSSMWLVRAISVAAVLAVVALIFFGVNHG